MDAAYGGSAMSAKKVILTGVRMTIIRTQSEAASYSGYGTANTS